jgi:ribosomal protein L7Ae-like RNA K-turn-binding protein
MGGRGASIHPRRACFAAAVKRGAFRRAWMRDVVVTLDQLVSRAIEQYRRRTEKLLLSARRKNSIAVRIDAVRQAIQMRQAELLVVAEDAAEYVSSPRERSVQLGRKLMFFGTEESLGRLFGDGATTVVALIDRAIAQELTRAAECMAALAEGA